jgi:hypothetical protein
LESGSKVSSLALDAHLKSSKTSRDSYLELEVSIFVKISEFLSSGRQVPLKLQKMFVFVPGSINTDSGSPAATYVWMES